MRDNRHFFDTASKILSHIHLSREGGPFSKVMSAVSIGGDIISLIYPEENARDYLTSRGYTLVETSVASYACTIISERLSPSQIISVSSGTQIFIWESSGGKIAAIKYNHDDDLTGPYVQGGDLAHFSATMESLLWRDSCDIMLSITGTEYKYADKHFKTSTMEEPGEFIGTIGVQYYVDRLRKYGPGARSVLIQGSTGVGKSVLARGIARTMLGGSGRTLKLSSSITHICSVAEIRDLVELFSPSVLLMDDVEFDNRQIDRGTLEMMEFLRIKDCLVIVTIMRDLQRQGFKGSAYFEGMRPGRIDETISLHNPFIQDRRLILEHYYQKFDLDLSKKTKEEIAHATDGLSGAYLQEFVKRLLAHGVKNWESEIKLIQMSAPRTRITRPRKGSWRRISLQEAKKLKQLQKEERKAKKTTPKKKSKAPKKTKTTDLVQNEGLKLVEPAK